MEVTSVLGSLKGKLQNTVSATVKGRTVMRAYQPNVANPKTESQVSNRNALTQILRIGQSCNSILNARLVPGNRVQSPFSSFTGQFGRIVTAIANAEGTLRDNVLVEYPQVFVASNLLIANGNKSFNLRTTPTVSASPATSTTATIEVFWQSGLLNTNDRNNDIFVITSLNISNPTQATETVTNVPRNDEEFSGSVNICTRGATDVVLLFAYFINATTEPRGQSKGFVFGHLVGTAFTATTTRTYFG